MKRALIAAGAAALLIVGLTGCNTNTAPIEPRMSRDELYLACLEAGGSFEYNGSLPYWQCSIPGAPLQK